MVISRALGFSPHPPVSDYGTVIVRTPYEVFLGSVIGPLANGVTLLRPSLGYDALIIVPEY